MERKSSAIGASGCPLAAMAVQYCKPLLTFKIGGVFSHSSTGSLVIDAVLKPLKYLLCDAGACARAKVSFL
jgi:hypothetical protein